MNVNDDGPLFGEQTLKALKKQGIDPYDTVFVGKIPFSAYLRKKTKTPSEERADALLRKLFAKRAKLFICRFETVGGLRRFLPPEQINPGERPPRKAGRVLNKRFAELERRLLAVNNSAWREIMQTAKKNAEFIDRFNNELFFKHVNYGGRRLTADELFAFYGTRPHREKIDLSSRGDEPVFCAVFAMTYYQCSPEDLYTIDGIFSPQPQRRADNMKKAAGVDVFNLILRNNAKEIDGVLERMGEVLTKLKPPEIALSDIGALLENYPLWAGLSEIGRLFSEIFSRGENQNLREALKSAEALKYCAEVVTFCEKIAVLSDGEDYRETKEYKTLAAVYK
ncbi:MAG: hypothetical protein LBI38_06440 [Oscillospiraceae bacterium]|jgi:hypothetical protein|nr:hypothetical protein [Oscillospiraceae bacterium]